MSTIQLSKEQIFKIRKRVEATTSGPWVASIEGRDHPLGGESVILRGVNSSENDLYLTYGSNADYDFIAHARQDIPLLLQEGERLLEKWRGKKTENKPLTQTYLDEIQERFELATPGPWIAFLEGKDFEQGRSYIRRGINGAEPSLYLTDATDADFDFIAHAREDIPFLFNEIANLRKLVHEM